MKRTFALTTALAVASLGLTAYGQTPPADPTAPPAKQTGKKAKKAPKEKKHKSGEKAEKKS
jgi:hypothetical protein